MSILGGGGRGGGTRSEKDITKPKRENYDNSLSLDLRLKEGFSYQICRLSYKLYAYIATHR